MITLPTVIELRVDPKGQGKRQYLLDSIVVGLTLKDIRITPGRWRVTIERITESAPSADGAIIV